MTPDSPSLEDSPLGAGRSLRFTTGELLLAVGAVGATLSGFYSAGVFGGALVGLATGVALIVRGHRTARTWLTVGGYTLAALSACTAGATLAAWLLLGIGPVYSAEDWPHGYTQMAEVAAVDPARGRVACIGSFIDSEYAWRLPVPPDALPAIVADLGLKPVPAQKVPPAFRQAFPSWWRPKRDPRCRYFATPGFPAGGRGPDGEHYFLMFHPGQNCIYVWHKSNF